MNATLIKDTAADTGSTNPEPSKFNAVTLAAFEETKAIIRGELPAKKYNPHQLEEAWKDLLDD